MPFKYNTARETVENNKVFAPGWHAAEIIRFTAKENSAGDPMMIISFKIAPNDDQGDAGKELPGFVNITESDMALALIEGLGQATGHDLEQEWGDQEIDVPFLISWGEGLIGELLEVNVQKMKPKPGQTAMFSVQGYRALDESVTPASVPADLRDLI